MKEMEVYTTFAGKLERVHSYIASRIILTWMFKRYDMRMWTRFVWLRMRIRGRLL
jgi:hypothetical protein